MREEINPPKLDEVEKISAAWVKIKRHLEARLEWLRARNDNDLDLADTAKMRGRIAEIKNLLTLDQPSPAVEE